MPPWRTSFLPPLPEPTGIVHRCHLAEEWTAYFCLPQDAARRALVSAGVRDSLSRLLRHYSSLQAKLWLPADNYPVYDQLAVACGFQPLAFFTIPKLELPRTAPIDAPELMVLTNPLKPLGRWLTPDETAGLEDWLRESAHRRLIVDAVYNLDATFHPTTLRLMETGQTILLHSLTKGWLHPRLFGIAFMPDSDTPILKESFRLSPLPQSNLAQARILMAQHSDTPAKVSARIVEAGVRLRSKLPDLLSDAFGEDRTGYFSPVQGSWSDFLHSRGILGLPASVFGSPLTDTTILSSLNFTP